MVFWPSEVQYKYVVTSMTLHIIYICYKWLSLTYFTLIPKVLLTAVFIYYYSQTLTFCTTTAKTELKIVIFHACTSEIESVNFLFCQLCSVYVK